METTPPGKIYIGVDNGNSGAISIIYPTTAIWTCLMPTIKVGKETWIDDIVLRDILNAAGENKFVVFEQGQKQPKFGCKGNFSQGYSFGVVRTTIRQNGIPHTAVNPRDWQKAMHLGVRSAGMDTGAASIEACRRLFPDVSLVPPGCRVPHDGIADALLMAEWGRRRNL